MVQVNLFAKQKQRHRHREKHMDTKWGKAGGGGQGMNWEIGVDINTVLCVE